MGYVNLYVFRPDQIHELRTLLRMLCGERPNGRTATRLPPFGLARTTDRDRSRRQARPAATQAPRVPCMSLRKLNGLMSAQTCSI